MNDLNDDNPEFAVSEAKPGQPQGVAVVVTMRPDRIAGGLTDGGACEEEAPPEGVRKTYRTGSWYFASDLLERMIEISSRECPGLRPRPAQVEITFVLDDKAYRQVGQIVDAFDRAYRGL